MSRAKATTLEKLHEEIAETLQSELKKYKDGDYDSTDDEGHITRKPVPASLIQSTIKYLKDNGIDRPDEEEPDPEDLLAGELPTFGEE